MTKYPHPPGSDQALLDGCKCPVQDNKKGAGYVNAQGHTVYWFNYKCKLHNVPEYAIAPNEIIYER